MTCGGGGVVVDDVRRRAHFLTEVMAVGTLGRARLTRARAFGIPLPLGMEIIGQFILNSPHASLNSNPSIGAIRRMWSW